jgi:hypothetical protein
MKHSIVCGSILFILIMACSSFAQISRSSQIEVFGGLAMPLAPDGFKDYWKMGYSIHGQYVIFPTTQMGVSFGLAYEGFTFDGDAFLEDYGYGTDGYDIDGSTSIVELCAGVRPYITRPEASTQFFLFGMGSYNFLSSEVTIKYDDPIWGPISETVKGDDDNLGIAGGLGVEIPAGARFNVIVQGVTRFIFTEDETTSFIGITLGVVF